MGQNFEMNVPGYESLAAVLSAAYDQAAKGKGKERHAEDNKPFDQQPMQLIADRRGIGFILGQADKKSEEAQGMLDRGEIDAAIREILGAIVYLAGSIIHINRHAVVDVVVDDEGTAEDVVADEQGDGFAPINEERTDQGYLLADGTYSGQYIEGDKFRIVRNDNCRIHSVGDVVTLTGDDGTKNPWFDNNVVCSWWKLVHIAQEKPTAKAFTIYHRLYKLAEEINEGWTPDWSNPRQLKFHVYFSHTRKVWRCDSYASVDVMVPAFKDRETANRAVELITKHNALGDAVKGVYA